VKFYLSVLIYNKISLKYISKKYMLIIIKSELNDLNYQETKKSNNNNNNNNKITFIEVFII
jgi:hypothetical protein